MLTYVRNRISIRVTPRVAFGADIVGIHANAPIVVADLLAALVNPVTSISTRLVAAGLIVTKFSSA